MNEYIACVSKEARLYPRNNIQSLYFGGGTPSLLSTSQWEKLLFSLLKYYSLTDSKEITVECNPESIVDKEKLKMFKQYGINRISLGVQTLHNHHLKYLGRNHDNNLAIKAYQLIRCEGFDNVSLDFMYGFPNQSTSDLQSDLNKMINLNPEHVSLYALDVEPDSRFYSKGVSVNSEIQAANYMLVNKILTDAGYAHYEISNYAKLGRESRHNIHYWQGGDYIGLGIGAHGHFNGRRYWNVNKLNEYFHLINFGEPAVLGEEILDSKQRFDESFLFGLRMMEGVNISELSKKFSNRLTEQQNWKLAIFKESGYLEFNDDCIRLRLRGKLVLDELCAQLI